MEGSDVSEAYKDVVARFLGEEAALRFTAYEKPGLLQRLFKGK
jgi:septum site-determining protein MinD